MVEEERGRGERDSRRGLDRREKQKWMDDARASTMGAASSSPTSSFYSIFYNFPLISALIALAIAHAAKLLMTRYKEKRWDVKQLVGSGGTCCSYWFPRELCSKGRKKKLSRSCMWAKTRTRKDGNPVNDAIAGLVEMFKDAEEDEKFSKQFGEDSGQGYHGWCLL